MVLIGKPAPQFSCNAVLDGTIKYITLSDFNDAYKVLFFYPGDFTFVCPTELYALQDELEEFKRRNVVVIGISVDSVYAHLEWLSKPRSQGGIQGVTFPLVGDIAKEVTTAYHVLNPDDGTALRATFILDTQNIIQVIYTTNSGIGRSTHEILRLVEAVQHKEQYGESCPVNWEPGPEGY